MPLNPLYPRPGTPERPASVSGTSASLRPHQMSLWAAFSADRVPADLDAVVIGSGIGGLCVAAIMAKAGKRVLVLEQHDQVPFVSALNRTDVTLVN